MLPPVYHDPQAVAVCEELARPLDPYGNWRPSLPGHPMSGRERIVQPPHLQAGEQRAPGWHLHVGPHLQAGPQAQDLARASGATAGVHEFGTEFLDVEFIVSSRK
jgi:hypothetical protein